MDEAECVRRLDGRDPICVERFQHELYERAPRAAKCLVNGRCDAAPSRFERRDIVAPVCPPLAIAIPAHGSRATEACRHRKRRDAEPGGECSHPRDIPAVTRYRRAPELLFQERSAE